MEKIITRNRESTRKRKTKLHSLISYQEYYYFSIIVMAPLSLSLSRLPYLWLKCISFNSKIILYPQLVVNDKPCLNH